MADKNIQKSKKALRRRLRVRNKVSGTSERPRLSVSKSLKNIFVQLIDDVSKTTLISASTNSKLVRSELKDGMNKTQQAFTAGQIIARLAKEKGIEVAVYDRNISRYHGRVKAVADGARKSGLKI